jgi:ribonuclease P protein component
MASTEVLKKRPDFLRVAKGRRWHGSGMVVQFAPRPMGDGKIGVGYTASRKVGGAVVRNRAKRRLRALVAELVPETATVNVDMVLIARAQTAVLPFASLRADLAAALAKVAGASA